jgi:hypothetical protein
LVRLATKPIADVAVFVYGNDTGSHLTIGSPRLAFGISNWSAWQPLWINAVDDDFFDFPIDRTVALHVRFASVGDPFYDSLVREAVGTVRIIDNDEIRLVLSTTNTTVEEGGTPEVYSVCLHSRPLGKVTVSLTVSPFCHSTISESCWPAHVVTNRQQLEFDDGNWDAPQEVQIIPINDHVDAGRRTVTITHTASSVGDDRYDRDCPPARLHVTVEEDEPAAIESVWRQTSLAEGSRQNATSMLSLELSGLPAARVEVTILVSFDSIAGIDGDDGGGVASRGVAPPGGGGGSGFVLSQLVVTPTVFSFDASNWSLPFWPTFFGVDDDFYEGTRQYRVTVCTKSADVLFHGLCLQKAVSVVEDDRAGIVVTHSGHLHAENTLDIEKGRASNVSVALTSVPFFDAAIVLSSADFNFFGEARLRISPSRIEFRPRDWNVPVWVEIAAIDDFIDEGLNVLVRLDLHSEGRDSTYTQHKHMGSVDVNITDPSGVFGVTVSPGHVEVLEGPLDLDNGTFYRDPFPRGPNPDRYSIRLDSRPLFPVNVSFATFFNPWVADVVGAAGLDEAWLPPLQPPKCVCVDACVGLNFDGVCHDGGAGSASSACPLGSDCSDCGPSTRCDTPQTRRRRNGTMLNPPTADCWFDGVCESRGMLSEEDFAASVLLEPFPPPPPPAAAAAASSLPPPPPPPPHTIVAVFEHRHAIVVVHNQTAPPPPPLGGESIGPAAAAAASTFVTNSSYQVHATSPLSNTKTWDMKSCYANAYNVSLEIPISVGLSTRAQVSSTLHSDSFNRTMDLLPWLEQEAWEGILYIPLGVGSESGESSSSPPAAVAGGVSHDDDGSESVPSRYCPPGSFKTTRDLVCTSHRFQSVTQLRVSNDSVSWETVAVGFVESAVSVCAFQAAVVAADGTTTNGICIQLEKTAGMSSTDQNNTRLLSRAAQSPAEFATHAPPPGGVGGSGDMKQPGQYWLRSSDSVVDVPSLTLPLLAPPIGMPSFNNNYALQVQLGRPLWRLDTSSRTTRSNDDVLLETARTMFPSSSSSPRNLPPTKAGEGAGSSSSSSASSSSGSSTVDVVGGGVETAAAPGAGLSWVATDTVWLRAPTLTVSAAASCFDTFYPKAAATTSTTTTTTGGGGGGGGGGEEEDDGVEVNQFLNTARVSRARWDLNDGCTPHAYWVRILVLHELSLGNNHAAVSPPFHALLVVNGEDVVSENEGSAPDFSEVDLSHNDERFAAKGALGHPLRWKHLWFKVTLVESSNAVSLYNVNELKASGVRYIGALRVFSLDDNIVDTGSKMRFERQRHRQVEIHPPQLTFTSENWGSAQHVEVRALDDDILQGTHGYTVRHHINTHDVKYQTAVVDNKAVVVVDDEMAGLHLDLIFVPRLPLWDFGSRLTEDEVADMDLGARCRSVTNVSKRRTHECGSPVVLGEGLSATYNISLATIPAYPVSVSMGWMVSEASSETNGMATEYTVSSQAFSGGSRLGMHNVLRESEPQRSAADEEGDDGGEDDAAAAKATTGFLVFDRHNWNIPKTITVTAVDDASVDGDRLLTLHHFLSSEDQRYGCLHGTPDPIADKYLFASDRIPERANTAPVSFRIAEDDVASTVLSLRDIGVEDGIDVSYTFRLSSMPRAAVTVHLDVTQARDYVVSGVRRPMLQLEIQPLERNPTFVPTAVPTCKPTRIPTELPTFVPTLAPTFKPTPIPPTLAPTKRKWSPRTDAPTLFPTVTPPRPTPVPTIDTSTSSPTPYPTPSPTKATPAPTASPTPVPTYVSDTSMLFTPNNWFFSQTVVLRVLPDEIVLTDPQRFNVTHRLESEDEVFNAAGAAGDDNSPGGQRSGACERGGLQRPRFCALANTERLAVTLLESRQVGIDVRVSNSGQACDPLCELQLDGVSWISDRLGELYGSIDINLLSEPRADVTISAQFDASLLRNMSPQPRLSSKEIIISPKNWKAPHVLTVSIQNDGVFEGRGVSRLPLQMQPARSADPLYNGWASGRLQQQIAVQWNDDDLDSGCPTQFQCSRGACSLEFRYCACPEDTPYGGPQVGGGVGGCPNP